MRRVARLRRNLTKKQHKKQQPSVLHNILKRGNTGPKWSNDMDKIYQDAIKTMHVTLFKTCVSGALIKWTKMKRETLRERRCRDER